MKKFKDLIHFLQWNFDKVFSLFSINFYMGMKRVLISVNNSFSLSFRLWFTLFFLYLSIFYSLFCLFFSFFPFLHSLDLFFYMSCLFSVKVSLWYSLINYIYVRFNAYFIRIKAIARICFNHGGTDPDPVLTTGRIRRGIGLNIKTHKGIIIA